MDSKRPWSLTATMTDEQLVEFRKLSDEEQFRLMEAHRRKWVQENPDEVREWEERRQR